jgi:hypothetical protein
MIAATNVLDNTVDRSVFLVVVGFWPPQLAYICRGVLPPRRQCHSSHDLHRTAQPIADRNRE